MTTETEVQTELPAGDPPPADPPADPPATSDEPEDDPEGDPEPVSADADPPVTETPRAKAGKKGAKTRASRAKHRANLANDADVQILLAQAETRGATKAQDAAAQAAKRDSMSEIERAQAEATDAKAALAEAQLQLAGQTVEREYGDALIESGLKVRAKSRRMFRAEVAEVMGKDDTLTHTDAIALVAEEHDNLLDATSSAPAPARVAATTPADPAVGQDPPPPQRQRSGAQSAPAPRRETAAPAGKGPPKPADVDGMSKKEFAAHTRAKHGINLQH